MKRNGKDRKDASSAKERVERSGLPKKIIYYTDELNDEFSSAQIEPRHIGDDYVYVHDGAFKRFTHFFWYRVVATPLAFAYLKLRFSHRIVGKKALREYRNSPFFLFGNHTQAIADALIPSMLSFPKDAYVIVHPNNVSMPILGRITPSLGALPLPDTLGASKAFVRAIATRVEQKKVMVVYPEAHIWPYYTGIRPFPDKSFFYPIKHKCPVFCFTNVYKKRRFTKRPRIVTYIDGPFFPDASLPGVRQRSELCSRVYAKMCERAALSDVNYYEYRKKEDEQKENIP